MVARQPAYVAPDAIRTNADDEPIDAINVLPAGGSTGQALIKTSGVDYEVDWTTIGGGGGIGDVAGPASSNDNRVTRFDGATGKAIQESTVGLDDSGNMTGVASIAVSGLVDGRDVSVDGTKLDTVATNAAAVATSGTPAAVAAAGALGAAATSARSDHAHAHGTHTDGTMHAAASISTGGFQTAADKQKEDDLAGGAVPGRRFTPLATQHDRLRAYRSRGPWIAGATASAPSVHGAGGTDHLWPFMVATCLDFEGYPHDLHQRLESNLSSGNNSGLKGYERGDFVAKGEFIRGRKLVYDGDGYMQNGVNVDAFFEFVLEPNPTASTSNYAGANRMRLLSGELGMTWPGNRGFDYSIELSPLSLNSYVARGIFRLYEAYEIDGGPRGQVIFEQKVRATLTGGLNALTTDAFWQLRWRVDRISNLNSYPGGNQGSTLQLAIENYGFTPVGFN